jgi:hypothetical protein
LADEQRRRVNIYYKPHVHRGKATQAAMYLRRGGVVGRSAGRTYIIVVPRPVPRPLPAVTRRSRSRRRRDAVAAGEGHLADEQK